MLLLRHKSLNYKSLNMKAVKNVSISLFILFLTLSISSNSVSALSLAPSAPNCVSINQNIYNGISGSEVKKLQRFLFEKGYLAAMPKVSKFGPSTVAAVKKFQADNNLIVTGNIGQISRDKIKEVSCGESNMTSQTIKNTQIQSTSTQKINYLLPEESISSKIIDGSYNGLKVFSKERIKNIYVTNVYKSGKDIIIEGSGFLALNRGPVIEEDTCLMHNNPDFSESFSDKKITLTNYVLCLPNKKNNYIYLGLYDSSLNLAKDAVYNKMYSNLGGKFGLEVVEVYNRYLVSSIPKTSPQVKNDTISKTSTN